MLPERRARTTLGYLEFASNVLDHCTTSSGSPPISSNSPGGRYGYRKIAELLRTTAGWVVNDNRVERVWRREGLKGSAKQPKRGRLWLADGS